MRLRRAKHLRPSRNSRRVARAAAFAACGAVVMSTTAFAAFADTNIPPVKHFEAAVDDPANQYLSAVLGSTGRFSEGAYPGSPSEYKIMYGWPGVGTSYTTIKVDGVSSVFGDNGSVMGPVDLDGTTNQTTNTVGSIITSQTIKLVSNPDTGRTDTAKVTYVVRNGDTVAHSIGVRFMNDVDVNDNDGAPFRLPNIGAVTTEQDLTGPFIPDTFSVYRDLADSQHIAAARISGGGATAPDRLIVGTWPGLVDHPWDYTTTPGLSITSDSAYAAYWNPTVIAPGQSRSVTTYYGLSDATVDLTPPLALGVTGPSSLSVVNNAYSPNPFTVTATVSDAGAATAAGVALTLNLPVGLHTSSQNPVSVGDLTPNSERQASWTVSADPNSNPLTIVNYSVTASSMNTAPKTVSRSLSRPSLAADRGTVNLHPGWSSDTDALTQGCARVMFIGLRGSGETYTASAPAGVEMTSLGNRISRAIPPTTPLRRVYIDYPSDDVSDFIIPGRGSRAFFASVADGVQRLRRVLLDSQAQCPHEKWIVAGYSQGALVAHEAATEIPNASQIAALDLVADPLRASTGNGTDLGNSRPHDGIYSLVHGRTPLPSGWLRNTFSLCNSRDAVCDIGQPLYAVAIPALRVGGPVLGTAAIPLFVNGTVVHLSYATAQPGQTQLDTMGVLSASSAQHALR